MYTKRFGKGRHGVTYSGRFKFSGGTSGAGKRGFKGDKIDPLRFVNKAQPVTEEAYISQNSFQSFNLDPRLLQNIIAKGYTSPMEIQDKTITLALAGKDIIGLANTGMGKTAAFLIPLIQKTVASNNASKTLIITPTRELAEQIRTELIALTRNMGIWSVLVIGGANIKRQIMDLNRNYNFVIGTPGRLKDLSNRRNLNFALFGNLVLDEVDRMFDMGFSRDIKLILSGLPKTKQSFFFSATITRDVDDLILQNSNNAERISVVKRETTASVDQDIIKVDNLARKIEILHDLLIKKDFEKVLIFGRTKWGVHKLSQELQRRGFKSESIHGGKTQAQRQRALASFRENKITILVATDVAARGLDIPNVTHIINYEVPDTYTDYIHRIGRTGRANKTGTALTFVS
jgi:superfamily II DNA/RNA helicase